MRELTKIAIVIVIPVLFAIVCFGVSESVMNGYKDCFGLHSIPVPPNCADSGTLLTRDILWFLGIILFVTPLATSIIIEWRKTFDKEIKMESIKISEQ